MRLVELIFLLPLLCHGKKVSYSKFPKIKYATKYPRYLSNNDMIVPVEPIEDFCAADLCPANKKHVACNTKFWGDACPVKRKGYDMSWYQQYIIDEYMVWLKYLPSLRASTIDWDDTLSKVAIRVVNRCEPDVNDDCANTSFFPKVAVMKRHCKAEMDVLTSIRRIVVGSLLKFMGFMGKNRPNFNYTNGLYVGCGIIDIDINNVYSHYMVCIHSAVGNDE